MDPRVVCGVYRPRLGSAGLAGNTCAVQRIRTLASAQRSRAHTDREAGVVVALELLELLRSQRARICSANPI